MTTGNDSGTMKVACPHCGKANEVTALELPAEQFVTCSHCAQPLGEWEELLFGSKNDNERPEARKRK